MESKLKKIIYSKAFFVFSIMILSFFGLISFIIGTCGQKKNIYEFYGNSSKIKVTDIYINQGKRLNENFETKNLKVDDDGNLLLKKTSDIPFLTIKLSILDEISLNFEKTNIDQFVIVKKNGKTVDNLNLNKKNNYSDSTRLLVLIRNYFEEQSLSNMILLIAVYIIFLVFVSLSIKTINVFIRKIELNKINLLDIIKFILGVFIIYLSCYYILLQVFGYWILLLILLLLLFVIYKLRKIIKNNLHLSFILISVIVGITMLFTLPPFQVPDEMAHFTNSFQKSYLFTDNHDISIKGDDGYTYLPVDVSDFIDKYGSDTLNSGYKVTSKSYLYDLYHNTNYKNISKNLSWYGNTKHSSVFAYIPSILSSIVLKNINVPVMILYLFGKLINLTITIILCYYAIKNVVSFKKIFFVVSLLPIFVHQSAAFNMDYLTNGIFIYLLYKILNEIFKPVSNKIIIKDIIVILLLSVILSICKFGYFPVLFLTLLIPNKRFKNKKQAIGLKFLFIISSVFVSLYTTGALNIFTSSVGSSSTRNAYAISNIWRNPVRIAFVIENTIMNRLDLDLFRGLFDGFGWSTHWNNSLLLFICELIMILIILSEDRSNKKISVNYKIVFLMVALMIFGIIYASMLFTWTTTGLDSIDGLQPRYFIPVVLLIYILLQNKYIRIQVKNNYLIYSIGMIIVNIICLFTIIKGFYI